MFINRFIVSLMIYFIYFSNIITLIIISVSDKVVKLSYYKYSIIILFFLVLLARLHTVNMRTLNNAYSYYIILAVVGIVISFNSLPIQFSNILQNIQFVFVIPISYFVGRSIYYLIGPNSFYWILKHVFIIAALAIIFGYFEFIFGKLIWSNFNLFYYYNHILGFENPMSPIYELPRSWISWDLYKYINSGYTRMVSFFVEPVGFGRFCAFVFILIDIYKNNIYKDQIAFDIFGFLMLSGVVLSLSKGGLLTIFFYFVLKYFSKKTTLLVFSMFMVLLYFLISRGYGEYFGSSVVNHYSSFFVGLVSIINNPIGFGVNVDDVFVANTFDLTLFNDFLTKKSEGSFALFSILFGVIGVFLFFLLFMGAYVNKKRRYISNLVLTSNMCLAILLSSIFAHSAFSLVGSGIPFILLGVLQAKNENENYF